jgi:alkylation response protein AidB-like acyl-CoA dehydrogenase
VDLTLSADQLALRAGLRDYLKDTWTPERLRSVADNPIVEAKDWRELADLGIFGLTQPETGGGLGLGMADAAIVFEELGRALVSGPLVSSFLAAGLVPGAQDGHAVVTMLDVAEPAGVVEHLGSATHVVLVESDGLFLLPAQRLTAIPATIPLDPMTPVSQVSAVLESEARANQIGCPADVIRWRRNGAALTSALQVGVAKGGLDLAVRYVRERTQFDRPIGSFQAVKHLLADSLARIDLARAAVLVAALTIDDPEAGDPDTAVSTAKILADEAATMGGRCCVQVHGGMGFTWEVLAHLYLKRAWLLETCFDSADEHATRLAATLSV